MKVKSKHIVNWLILFSYFSLLFINVFHFHQHNIKITSQSELINQENNIDPFQDESGICRVEHFFNHTFNAQLKSSLNYFNQSQPPAIIRVNFIFNPFKKFFTSFTLRSPPFLF